MFVPHSEIDLKKMFEELSISSLDDLFTHIPETLKLNDGLNVPVHFLSLNLLLILNLLKLKIHKI